MSQLADSNAMEELHHRENDGIAVSLLGSRRSKTPQGSVDRPGVTR